VLEPVTEQNVFDVVTTQCGATTYSTVSAFKGLENDYIVLADVESLDSDWWRLVVYVGHVAGESRSVPAGPELDPAVV
jgi:hypothetical protein